MRRVFSHLTRARDWRLFALAGVVCLLAGLAGTSLLDITMFGAIIAALGVGLLLTPLHRRLADQKRRLDMAIENSDTALHNISQGLSMFDGEQRLVICNRHYLEMYGLSAEIVKPGCTFREVIRHRAETGSLREDPEPYLKKILDTIAEGRVTRAVTETDGGRQIAIVTRPLPGGGWVTTHEDITPQWQAERALAAAKARLLEAFDVVPAGLVLFDAEDRYVM